MVDGNINLFFPLKGDTVDSSTELDDGEIRDMVAKPGDSEQVIEHKLRVYKASVGFENREKRQQHRSVIVEGTSDSVADRVAQIAAGPSARLSVDVLAEHLWWLTQGAEGWFFPESKAARASYRNAARKVLAQVGNDAWRAACDACLFILREPTADERKWMGRCSSPHGWISGVVKRVIAERIAAEKARQRQYADVSMGMEAQALWSKILGHLSERVTRLNVLELQDGTATWQAGCLCVSFPLGQRSMVAAGGLEMEAERAASKICNALVEVCFEIEERP